MKPAPPSTPGRRTLPVWVWLVFAALPWAWFLLRDTLPLLDAVSVVLPIVGVVALVVGGVVAITTARLLPLVTGVSAFAAVAFAVLGPRSPEPAAQPVMPIRIAAANIARADGDARGAVDALSDRRADVLVVVEMPRSFGDTLERASPELRHHQIQGEIGVWSRWPIRDLPLPDGFLGSRVFRVRVDAEAPFVLYAVHAQNPLYEESFADQQRLDRALAAAAAREELPVVVAGDLNLSDRAGGYRILTGVYRDAMRAGVWATDTYRLHIWRALLLRIDHVFVPATWCAMNPEVFPIPTSDHEGIAATIGPCPGA